MDKTWKKVERRFAEYLGGIRVPVTGRQRGDAPDIEHPTLSIEVKHRQSLPDWILDAMNQAEESNPGDKMPVVLLHAKGMKMDESLSILRCSDLKFLMKKIDRLEMQIESLQDDLAHVETYRD